MKMRFVYSAGNMEPGEAHERLPVRASFCAGGVNPSLASRPTPVRDVAAVAVRIAEVHPALGAKLSSSGGVVA
jgi:hypothetical protein